MLEGVSNEFHHFGISLPLKICLHLGWDEGLVEGRVVRLCQGIGKSICSSCQLFEEAPTQMCTVPSGLPLPILLHLCLLPVCMAHLCPASPCYFGATPGSRKFYRLTTYSHSSLQLAASLRHRGREVGRDLPYSGLCPLTFHPSFFPLVEGCVSSLPGRPLSPQTIFFQILWLYSKSSLVL
ncbi:putative uncharacterized protein FLJ44553 [Chlorocebus sabaeus]|uniref:putative uncharacterized protein FLJ44553 n=1 Tax=Chlorocebus sabaeus TaxID=60711 RepID=UPI003BF94B8F